MRGDRKYDQIPIVIYSAAVNKNDIDNAYRHGANYFIIKPDAVGDIANIMKKICTMGREALLLVPPIEEFVII